MMSRRPHRAALAWVVLAGCAFGEQGMDASADVGRRDAGRSDASPMDAEPSDAEPSDAEPSDAEPPDADPADGEAPDVPPTGPRIEVGTGAIQFEPLSEGQVVELSSGPQGGGRFDGFHVWFGARSHELDPNAISVTFILMLASDRSELARLSWVTNFRPTAGEAYEIWGANPRISDCCAAVSQELVMRVEALDADGVTAAAEIRVVGEDECADLSMSYCP
jgi:hypothetical protein